MCIRDRVNVYAADQLTNGNQSEGIQALMNGDPVQISMHSNLIYSAFDPRFNVVSLPFLFDSVEDADAKLDGEAGEKLKAILDEYNLHCMGIAENGFRQLTNSRQEVRSVEDMKNLKIRVAGSNLLMECYKRWGADATNMNWSETYTALQQKTVEGQENPLPAIDAASVQEVQPYCSLWKMCIRDRLIKGRISISSLLSLFRAGGGIRHSFSFGPMKSVTPLCHLSTGYL